jgi:hypothetical protein
VRVGTVVLKRRFREGFNAIQNRRHRWFGQL